MSELCVILSTCPDISTARAISYRVVQAQQAACVNIIPGLISIYQWEGRTQQESECQMVIKTTKSTLVELQELVFAVHPYQEPEWLVLDVDSASPGYLDWIRSVVT